MPLTPGARLGSYEVLGPLGAGGMGEVFRARDTKLGREVALKLLPEGLASSPDLLSRLEREARTLASLHHPHVATLFAFEEHDSQRFLVMELVPGETLAERIARGPLPLREALALFRQIAEGLEAAHEKGVVHRDLKPANIKITPDGRAKVLDFGLAKAVEPTGDPISSELPTETHAGTTPGVIVGTAAYMSPEQARGLTVDRRTDVWAFGACLYEALSGRRAFAGATLTDVLARVLEREPDWDALPEETPAPVRQLLGRCLRKDARERARDIGDVRLQLAEALGPSPPGAGNSARARVPSRPAGWRRARAWMSAAALLIVGGGGAVGFWAFRRLPAIDSVAVLPFVNSSGNVELDYLGDGISEELINQLAQVPALRVIARPTAFSYRGRDVQPQAIGVELKVAAVVTGHLTQHGDVIVVQVDVVDTRDGSELWGGRFERPRAELSALQPDIVPRVTQTLRLRLSPEQNQRLARPQTVDPEAYQAYLRGRIALSGYGTAEDLRECIAYFQESIRRDPAFALGWAGLADAYTYLAMGESEAPARMVLSAREAAQRALQLEPGLAEGHTSLGIIKLMFDWDFPAAEAEFRRAIALSPGDIFALHWLAHYLETVGRYPEARVALRQAADLDPLSPMYQADLALQHYLMGEPRSVLALAAQVGAFSKPHALPGVLLAVALAQEQLGERDGALLALEKVSPDCEDCMGGGLHGYLYGRLGFRDRAQRVLAELEARSRTRFVSGVDVAVVAAGLGDTEKALEALERAFDQRSSLLVYWIRYPFFDSLRAHPRFQALTRRLGLPASETPDGRR